jgi:hypothetical protein
MESLPETFSLVAKRIIEADPQKTADYVLEKEKANWKLKIPKQDSSGFDIVVVADSSEVTVHAEYGAHRHFTSEGNHEETVRNALGLARDLLSENMRVRVFSVFGMTYRFDFEWYRYNKWENDGTTVLLGLPWFLGGVQKFYSNHRLPPRSCD